MTNLKNKKFNILFISSDDNYFVENTPSFYRMYKNLHHFYKHQDYNVIVLQPSRGKKHEDKTLKENIISYYFKEIIFLRNRFIHFTDFNPFFIVKIIKILKKYKIDLIHVDYLYGITVIRLLTNIPISYNAYNVEGFFWKQIVKTYHKIPIFLRTIYAKYIFFLEKQAIKIVTNINAISFNDKKYFLKNYDISDNKIFVNRMGLNEEVYNNPILQNRAKEKLNIKENQFVVIFHGSYFNNVPNREAIQIIKDKIVSKVNDEDIIFLIAGHMPFFKNKKNLRFLGFVHNLPRFLYSADVAIIPLFKGSGIKTKVVDYLSSRIPVILTKQAAKGLNLKNGVHGYIVSDENPIDEMVEKIIELKNDILKLREFKNNILHLLEEEYDWDKILIALEERYRNIIIRYI